ncbi:MAG: ATP-binding protein [Actinomycetota bacterium]
MKRLLPDSIAGRTLLVLLVGLTLSHLAGIALVSSDRHDTALAASDRLAAERVAVVASQVDGAPPAARTGLAAALSSPSLTVSLAAGPEVASSHHDDMHLAMMAEVLEPRFGPVGHDRLHVVHTLVQAHVQGFSQQLLHGFPKDMVMAVSFRLADGSWANFHVAMARQSALWSAHTLVSTLVMMAAILVLGAWAAGWAGRPLGAFAKAADRLGRDVAAPPLPEDGPAEVRRAATAFNEMQARIRRFVDDRTQMLAAISHDLRSPITRLRLRAEMLPDGEGKERTLADLAEMEGMVASTLDFARGEAGDEAAQPIDLAATLEAVCDNATDMGLMADFHWDGRLVCTCRPTAIKRALANLVENAARYGGHASVRASVADGSVTVTIDDDGPGIPAAELERVFAPFFRLEGSRNRKTGGMGLGLTVARSIIRAHGGDIRLENRAQGGLRAVVTIPQGDGP